MRKKKEPKFKLNKKHVLARLLELPASFKKEFYMKEFFMLKKLMAEFPKEEFWAVVTFPKKYPSLAFLLGPLKNELKKKYVSFNYVIPQSETVLLGEKIGEDRIIDSKPSTIRDFLNAT